MRREKRETDRQTDRQTDRDRDRIGGEREDKKREPEKGANS